MLHAPDGILKSRKLWNYDPYPFFNKCNIHLRDVNGPITSLVLILNLTNLCAVACKRVKLILIMTAICENFGIWSFWIYLKIDVLITNTEFWFVCHKMFCNSNSVTWNNLTSVINLSIVSSYFSEKCKIHWFQGIILCRYSKVLKGICRVPDNETVKTAERTSGSSG